MGAIKRGIWIGGLIATAVLAGLAACTTATPDAAPAPPVAAVPPAAVPVQTPPAPPAAAPSPARPVPPGVPAPSSSAGSPTMGEFSVSMQRGACFGRCPIYRVTIHSDGRVEFDGQRFVKALGKQNKTIAADEAAKLGEPARTLFASMGDFMPGQGGCKQYATDMPQIELQFDDGSGPRTIRHYTGCANPPAALGALEHLIDATADISEWVKGSAER